MRVAAAILASGSGSRFGGDKVLERLGDRPLWRWSYDAFAAHPEVHDVLVVRTAPGIEGVRVVPGGETRQGSARAAFAALPDADLILFHDAARPFVSAPVIEAVIAAAAEAGAAAPALPVTDTVREVGAAGLRLLDRSRLKAMQTPQGVRREVLARAYASNPAEFTDDLALAEATGVMPVLVEGDVRLFKVTTADDLARARAMIGPLETRTGLGYDVHRFSEDPARTLMLGGVAFPAHPALEGHSDADVLLHAAVDALLGAAAMGDIGQHFPPSDPRWKGEPSLTFLNHARQLLSEQGWRIVHLDIAMIGETPKVMPRATEIRACIAEALGVTIDRVSLKATTNEGLGAIGRKEGLAAFATATIAR